MDRTDILVSGAGIAGLTAAAVLARRGWRVTICDPAPPPQDDAEATAALRSTAYLQPSVRLFEEAGLWDDLAPHATSLAALRVIDTVGAPPREAGRRTFDAADLGLGEFGWNVPNWRARKLLTDRLAGDPAVDLRLGTGFAAQTTRDAEAIVTLTDGARIAARLVVGADGRGSPVREAAGIDLRVRRYGQVAFAFVAAHPERHDGISTEIYARGGAFTTVPLPDAGEGPASAVVWMNDARRAETLAGLGERDFDVELTLRSLGLYGPMRRMGGLRRWPVVTQTAAAMTARRTALVAEAAHVLPPIGAQGLNTSLADVAALADALGDDPGDAAALGRYAGARHGDVAARAAVIDLFNRVCRSDGTAVRGIRAAGLRAVHDLPPVRRGVMRAGLGAPG